MMTDAGYSIRVSPRVFRIGTAGGATRGSTGYTLAAAQRQARVIAQRLFDGHVPVPPLAYPPRHRYFDAILLRAIDRHLVSGPDLFADLFSAVPPDNLVRFLDGQSSWPQDLTVMRAAPVAGMLRAGALDSAARVRARVAPVRRRAVRAAGSVVRSVVGRYVK